MYNNGGLKYFAFLASFCFGAVEAYPAYRGTFYVDIIQTDLFTKDKYENNL